MPAGYVVGNGGVTRDAVILPGDGAVYLVATAGEVNLWSLGLRFLPDVVMITLLLLAAWATWRLWRLRRFRASPTGAWCRRCAYPLHDPVATGCSECGRDLTTRRGRIDRPRLHRRRLRLGLAAAAAAVATAAVLAADEHRMGTLWPWDRPIFRHDASPLRTHRAAHLLFHWPSTAAYGLLEANVPATLDTMRALHATGHAEVLLRVDPRSGSLRRVATFDRRSDTISIPSFPPGFIWWGDRAFLWVPTPTGVAHDHTLSLFEVRAGGEVRRVARLPHAATIGLGWKEFVLSPDGRHLAVIDQVNENVYVFDTDRGSRIASLAVEGLRTQDVASPSYLSWIAFSRSEPVLFLGMRAEKEWTSWQFAWRYTVGQRERVTDTDALWRPEPRFQLQGSYEDGAVMQEWGLSRTQAGQPVFLDAPAVLPVSLEMWGAEVDDEGRLVALRVAGVTHVVVWDRTARRWAARLDAPGVADFRTPFGFAEGGRQFVVGGASAAVGGTQRLYVYDLSRVRAAGAAGG